MLMRISHAVQHRLTATLCTIVAAAILAVGVTAQIGGEANTPTLQQLESDLRFQIRSAFRLEPRVAQSRLAAVDEVVAAYRESPRSESDKQRFYDWLGNATRLSMPGSLGDLPESPEFGITEVAIAPKRTGMTNQEPPPIPQPEVGSPDTPLVLPEAVPVETENAKSTIALITNVTVPENPAPPVTAVAMEAPRTERETQATVTDASSQLLQDKVTINLAELQARTAGFHQGLSDLETSLLETTRPTERQIRHFCNELASLVPDYQFVKLYYESLSTKERGLVKAPRELGQLISQLRMQLDELQKEIDSDFLGEFDAQASERLEQSRLQLDEIEQSARWQ